MKIKDEAICKDDDISLYGQGSPKTLDELKKSSRYVEHTNPAVLAAHLGWWHRVGSALRPVGDEDQEQHAYRVSQEAFMAGFYHSEDKENG